VSSPQAVVSGVTFWPVPEFDTASVAFGADRLAYLPRHELPDVPRKYMDMASGLFFSGGSLPKFAPQVDGQKAARAVRAWLSSWEPSHEQKEATVGYALWLWTDADAIAAMGGSL
jgi:hypothetical protein